MSKKNLNPSYWHPWGIKNDKKKWNRIEKIMGPQSKEGQKLKKKPLNGTKASSQTPKIIFVCCSIVIKIQR